MPANIITPLARALNSSIFPTLLPSPPYGLSRSCWWSLYRIVIVATRTISRFLTSASSNEGRDSALRMRVTRSVEEVGERGRREVDSMVCEFKTGEFRHDGKGWEGDEERTAKASSSCPRSYIPSASFSLINVSHVSLLFLPTLPPIPALLS